MASLIRQFFEKALKAYQVIVERNFSGVVDRFETYKRLPLSVIAEYRRPTNDEERRDWGDLRYALVPADLLQGQAEVRIDPREATFRLSSDEQQNWVDYRGRLVYELHDSTLHYLLSPIGPGFSTRQSEAGCLCPIRGYVYNLLRQEFRRLTTADLLYAVRAG
jgi:hypothetical protein